MVEKTPTWKPFAPLLVALFLVIASPDDADAQTDYYNTDAGRPIRVEDAYALERRAFEIQLAPLRLERTRGGVYQWGIEPELAYGIFPRTHVEVGAPLEYVDAGANGNTAGLAGIDVSVFHALNAETRIPALAVALGALFPAGPLGPDKTYASVKGIVTRTFSWARFHANAEYTFGNAVEDSGNDDPSATLVTGGEVSRWMAGLAVDRTFPLRALLVTGEVFAEKPLVESEDVQWNVGIGSRYQLGPRFSADAGIGRRLTGDDQSWYMTFGAAVAYGLPWRP